jgi:predicted FMN-binding regulatory protein PaiB
VHIERAFRQDSVQTARAIVREHPFATIVTADLRATHMPCLLDEDPERLTHVRGTPELLDDAMPVLRRTVDHFEAAVEDPWSLERLGETAREMADQVVAFRLRADTWHAEAKLSQDKPREERERVLAGLERPGPYANAPLAQLMRRLAL